MNEFASEFLDDGSELVGGSEIVNGLGEADEDSGNLELVVSEVFDDVGVEGEDGELVGAAHSSKDLHDENFVVEGVGAVVFDEGVVEFFSKRLGIVEELKGRKVDGGFLGGDFALASFLVRGLDVLLSLPLGRLLLLVDLESMLDRLDIGTFVVLVLGIGVFVLSRLGGNEEEVNRRVLHLRVGMEARRSDDRDRLGVPPHILPP